MKRSVLCPVPAELSQFPPVAPEFYTSNVVRDKRFFTVDEPVGGIVMGPERRGRPWAVAAGYFLPWGPHG